MNNPTPRDEPMKGLAAFLRDKAKQFQKEGLPALASQFRKWAAEVESRSTLPAAEVTEPQTGNWIAADDYYRNVKALDEALNGKGGATRPLLIDILAQVNVAARKLGRPLLAGISDTAPAPTDEKQRLQKEQADFFEWWRDSGQGAEPLHAGMVIQNVCAAAWQERARRAAPPSVSVDAKWLETGMERALCRCDACGRKSWDAAEVGSFCTMPQPSNRPCSGIMRSLAVAQPAGDAGQEAVAWRVKQIDMGIDWTYFDKRPNWHYDNGFEVEALYTRPISAIPASDGRTQAQLEEQAAEQGITVEQLLCHHEWPEDEGHNRMLCVKCGLDGDG